MPWGAETAKETTKPKAQVYYKDQDFFISATKARSKTKTYRIDKIEKVSLRRDVFYASLAFTALVAFFYYKFSRIFGAELFVLLGVGVAASVFTSRIGLLFITSKAVSELAFIGQLERLEKVRNAIEKAMHKEDEDDGFVADHDEDEDS